MSLLRAGLVAGLCLALAGAARAQAPVDTLSLRLDALLAAVTADAPGLRAARLEAEALATRAAQVTALPDPTVMASYQPLPLLTARGYQRSQWRVEQPIPFPGKRALRGEVADLSAAVANAEVNVYAADLALDVKRAYYELYRIQAQSTLIAAFRDRLATFEAIATTQYEVGTGPQQAILKAQVEASRLRQRLTALRARRRTALETLARLTNRPQLAAALAGATWPEVTLDVLPLPEVAVETLVGLALRRRQEVEALDLAEARAETQVRLAEKAFMPDFGVNLTYFDIGAADVPPTATGRDAMAIGVSVKVPLQRGRLRAQVEEAELRVRAVDARQEALRTSVATTIADVVSQMREEAAQHTLYTETLIPQAEATLEATLSAYTTGRTGFLDLLDAERVLFTLRTGLEDTTARYLQATALLERTLGLTDLARLSDVLDASSTDR